MELYHIYYHNVLDCPVLSTGGFYKLDLASHVYNFNKKISFTKCFLVFEIMSVPRRKLGI